MASPIQQKPLCHGLITENILTNFCLAMTLPNWAEHLHQHSSRTWSIRAPHTVYPKTQAAALSSPHSICSAAPTGSASNTAFSQMLRHSGKGTDRTACSEKHNYLSIRTLEKKGKVKKIKGNEPITSAFPEPSSWVMPLPLCFKGQSWHSSCETFLLCSQHWGP